MIHRDDSIEFSVARRQENGVARIWARHVNSLIARHENRRLDDPLFFVAELPVFRGVRIHSGHRDARFFDAKPVDQRLVHQFDRLKNGTDIQLVP